MIIPDYGEEFSLPIQADYEAVNELLRHSELVLLQSKSLL